MSECEHHPGDAWQCATCLRAKVAELEARLAEAERLNIANVFGWTRYDAKLAAAEKRGMERAAKICESFQQEGDKKAWRQDRNAEAIRAEAEKL